MIGATHTQRQRDRESEREDREVEREREREEKERRGWSTPHRTIENAPRGLLLAREGG